MRSIHKTLSAFALAAALAVCAVGCAAPKGGDEEPAKEKGAQASGSKAEITVAGTTSTTSTYPAADGENAQQEAYSGQQPQGGQVAQQPVQQQAPPEPSTPAQSALVECGIMSASELSTHNDVVTEQRKDPESGRSIVEGVMYIKDLPEGYDGVPGSTYRVVFDESGSPVSVMFDGDEMPFDEWKYRNNVK